MNNEGNYPFDEYAAQANSSSSSATTPMSERAKIHLLMIYKLFLTTYGRVRNLTGLLWCKLVIVKNWSFFTTKTQLRSLQFFVTVWFLRFIVLVRKPPETSGNFITDGDESSEVEVTSDDFLDSEIFDQEDEDSIVEAILKAKQNWKKKNCVKVTKSQVSRESLLSLAQKKNILRPGCIESRDSAYSQETEQSVSDEKGSDTSLQHFKTVVTIQIRSFSGEAF